LALFGLKFSTFYCGFIFSINLAVINIFIMHGTVENLAFFARHLMFSARKSWQHDSLMNSLLNKTMQDIIHVSEPVNSFFQSHHYYTLCSEKNTTI